MKKIAIIGAGLGGLTAGALLAKDGYSVTILEQHNIVGGSATTFKRKGGFSCEVGLHEMDSLYEDYEKDKIFRKLNVYDNVKFIKANELYRVKRANLDFIMPDGIDEAKEKLSSLYPDEKEAIERYFLLIEAIYSEFIGLTNLKWSDYLLFPFKFRTVLKYKNSSTKDVFDKLFKSEDLKLILNANISYYSDNWAEFSFLMHAVAQYSYFNGGGWFIQGGSQNLSDYLKSIIIENGGEVITKALVSKVGKNSLIYRKSKEDIGIDFDIVLSNASPIQTYKMYGIEDSEFNSKQLSNSLLSIYIGFNKSLKSVYGKRAYSSFFLRDFKNMDEFSNAKEQNIKDRGFVFVDYSQIDSKLTKDADKSFGVITTFDYLKDWIYLDKYSYEEKKEIVKDAFLSELEKEYPNIKEYIEFCEVGTAKTMQRYLKTPNGTAYGFAPTKSQFFKIPQVKSKKIDNLYFVGQWVICGGFSPAIHSGRLAYEAISNKKI